MPEERMSDEEAKLKIASLKELASVMNTCGASELGTVLADWGRAREAEKRLELTLIAERDDHATIMGELRTELETLKAQGKADDLIKRFEMEQP